MDVFCADRDKTTGFFDGTYHALGKDVDAHPAEFAENIDMILPGANSLSLAQSLLKANLFDEIQLMTGK
ncbi:MAG: hypothetical protein ABJB11_00980 [Ferruginibacter sp.]